MGHYLFGCGGRFWCESNLARKNLFTQKARAIDNIPPTQAALLQHTKRAIFQASYIWAKSLEPHPIVPLPIQWGWVQESDSSLIPVWSDLPEVQKVCLELVKCGCKLQCSKHCKCVKAALKCISLCKCKGECSRWRLKLPQSKNFITEQS